MKIYSKFQYFYYIEHIKHLSLLTSNSQLSSNFIEEIVNQYSLFSIKRRVVRRKIG